MINFDNLLEQVNQPQARIEILQKKTGAIGENLIG